MLVTVPLNGFAISGGLFAFSLPRPAASSETGSEQISPMASNDNSARRNVGVNTLVFIGVKQTVVRSLDS
jgi:hypothetical protein